MSFNENFERGEKENENYDDTAFYIYGFSILTVLLTPLTWKLVLKPIFFYDFYIPSNTKTCQCDICTKRLQKRKEYHRLTSFTPQFYMNALVICCLWYIAYLCFDVIKYCEPIKTFEPHEMLGIEINASVAEVKKAYRRLARTMHPDKNPDNPEASYDFMLLTKAYTILTDEKARTNFLKYGNPDGKGRLEVALALPNFLHDKDYHKQIMFWFYIFIVFFVPFQFIRLITQFDMESNEVDMDTRRQLRYLIDENIDQQRIPGILQFSSEFQAMQIRSKEEFELCKRLRAHETIKKYIPKLSSSSSLPQVQIKPIVLLVGHMFGLLKEEDLMKGKMQKDLEKILTAIPNLIEVMIQQTLNLAQLYKIRRSPRRIFAKNIMTQIQFSQNLMSRGFINANAFSQLPFVEDPECKRIRDKIGKRTFYNYCGGGPDSVAMDREDRLDIAPYIFGHKAGSPELKRKFEQQELAIDALPMLKITMTAEVFGEDEICVGDVLTCKLKVEFLNLDQGSRSGYVHSKDFPFLRRDNWYLIITDENLIGLAAAQKIKLGNNWRFKSVFEKEFTEIIMRPGRIAFTVILMNDSYRGLDQMQKVEVMAKAEAANRERRDYSIYDLKAIRQQNAIQEFKNYKIEESDSDEADALNEEDELRRKLVSAGLRSAAGAAPESSSEAEDESDSDSDDANRN